MHLKKKGNSLRTERIKIATIFRLKRIFCENALHESISFPAFSAFFSLVVKKGFSSFLINIHFWSKGEMIFFVTLSRGSSAENIDPSGKINESNRSLVFYTSHTID